jgi:hypothetical protein
MTAMKYVHGRIVLCVYAACGIAEYWYRVRHIMRIRANNKVDGDQSDQCTICADRFV